MQDGRLGDGCDEHYSRNKETFECRLAWVILIGCDESKQETQELWLSEC